MFLDAENAFDSLEWPFFISIVKHMGMPKGFIALTELLYAQSKARLNGTLSEQFSLHRGTRQGCPLSPLLFILAMDPLVRQFQESHLHRGLHFNTGRLLSSLYADDIILYVGFPQVNLDPLIREIIRFGLHSGLQINWSKSVLFPLTPSTQQWECEFPLFWCPDATKYLGIHIHLDTEQIISLNYGRAVDQLETQIEKWLRLPLSLAGRTALIKMVVLPKFLYLFNIPIPLPNRFFSMLNSLLIKLIWGG